MAPRSRGAGLRQRLRSGDGLQGDNEGVAGHRPQQVEDAELADPVRHHRHPAGAQQGGDGHVVTDRQQRLQGGDLTLPSASGRRETQGGALSGVMSLTVEGGETSLSDTGPSSARGRSPCPRWRGCRQRPSRIAANSVAALRMASRSAATAQTSLTALRILFAGKIQRRENRASAARRRACRRRGRRIE